MDSSTQISHRKREESADHFPNGLIGTFAADADWRKFRRRRQGKQQYHDGWSAGQVQQSLFGHYGDVSTDEETTFWRQRQNPRNHVLFSTFRRCSPFYPSSFRSFERSSRGIFAVTNIHICRFESMDLRRMAMAKSYGLTVSVKCFTYWQRARASVRAARSLSFPTWLLISTAVSPLAEC